MKKQLLVCLSLAVFLTALAEAGSETQEDQQATRPRIGLVLSGGAALGSAHVGVLKVLEELRIPVDFVAGTSMGAIIGGLYSAGVSPAEMEAILTETNWRDVLDDRPARRHLPYRQKVDDQTFLMKIEAGFNDGSFQMPPGLISGQKLGFALQRMVHQAVGVDDFDDLPIPFRAVATDLESGELVVLRGGDLGLAMRASMSLPGVFSPMEIDGRLLVDGGLVHNLPVDVASEMGADVVIAVDVGKAMPGRDRLASLMSVTGQVIAMQSLKNLKEQISRADVLIRPELDGFGAFQFERGSEMVTFGEMAARSVVADLEQYSVSEEAYQAYLQHLRQPKSFSGATVSSVVLTSDSTSDPKFVMRHLRTRPGDPLDLEAIRKDLERLYETGDYERVDYHLSEDAGGNYSLFIQAIDKSWGPNYLRFGLNLTADLEGDSSFDVLASYTMTKLNRMRGELKAKIQIGENPSILGEFYQPLSYDQTWFAAVRMNRVKETEFLPVGGGTFSPYQIDIFDVGLDLGFQMGRYGELRLGLIRDWITTEVRDGVDPGPVTGFSSKTEADLGGIHFSAIVDQFDSMNFPRHGYFAVIDYLSSREEIGSDANFELMVAFLGGAVTRGKHTVLGLCNLYSALGTDSPVTSSLGGPFKLSGAPTDSITGRYGGNLSALYLYHLLDLPLVMGEGLYVGASVEAGNMWREQHQASINDLRYASSVFVGAETMFGPLYLALGFFEGGDNAVYLLVGRSF